MIRLLLLAVLLWLPAVQASPGTRPSLEELKAVFVYNFLKFVEWPEEKSRVRLCVVGETPLAPYLEALDGEKVHRVPLVVSRACPREAPRRCDAVFLGELAPGTERTLLSSLGRRPVLTVSDREGFLDRGGIIELFLRGKRLRFRVNLSLAQEVGLRVSARLLRMAEEVR